VGWGRNPTDAEKTVDAIITYHLKKRIAIELGDGVAGGEGRWERSGKMGAFETYLQEEGRRE